MRLKNTGITGWTQIVLILHSSKTYRCRPQEVTVYNKKEKVTMKIANSTARYFFVLIFSLILTSTSFANETGQISSPEELIRVFYSTLASDKDVSKYPEIFFNPASFASVISEKYKKNKELSDSEVIWTFLKENQKLFLFQNLPPDKTLDLIRISYLFSNFPSNKLIFDGKLSVVLIGTMSKKGKDGIMKEITFPLEKTSGFAQHKYLINLDATRINGAYIEPNYSEFRRGEMFQMLGFTSDP